MSDERKRIYELDSAETIASNDSLIIDNPNRDEAVKIPVNSFKTLLTQTQYDALPSSKNTDGIIYYITDNNKIMLNGNAYGGGFDADAISYDNTSSAGVQATNVQDALDEAFARTLDVYSGLSNVSADTYNPTQSYTVGDYCFYWQTDSTIQRNNIYLYKCIANTSGAFDSTKWQAVKIADEIKEVNSTIDNLLIQKSIENTDIASFTDGSDLPMPKLQVGIEPQQDLHGYDSPWVGGAGKNKLPVTVENIKASNADFTWSGNAGTKYGVSFTVNNDGTVTANGTATGTTVLYLSYSGDLWSSGSYILNGCPRGGSSDTYALRIYKTGITLATDTGNGASFTGQSGLNAGIVIWNGTTLNNAIFKPMIRLASETDATFEPYENICPISGWTSVTTKRTNRNCLPANDLDSVTTNGITFTKNADGSITANGTATAVTLYWILGTKNDILKLPNGRYTLNGCPSGGSNSTYRISSYNPNENGFAHDYGSGVSFDYLAEGAKFAIVVFAGATLNNVTFKPMIRLATDTDATYEPYNGQTYNIQFKDGDNPLTVYGGTLDVVSGELVVDRVIVDIDGSENGWSTDQVGTQNRRRFTCTGLPSLGTSEDTTFDAISNMFVNTKSSDYINMDNVFILRYLSQYRTNRIDIMTETYQDLTAFKSFLSNSNLTVVYELATPLTYQLTPTQVKSILGSNNVWADTGKILKLEYLANATDVIASLDARITALENQ